MSFILIDLSMSYLHNIQNPFLRFPPCSQSISIPFQCARLVTSLFIQKKKVSQWRSELMKEVTKRNQEEDGAHGPSTIYLSSGFPFLHSHLQFLPSLEHPRASYLHRLTCLKEGVAMKIVLKAFNSRLININTQVFLIMMMCIGGRISTQVTTQ